MLKLGLIGLGAIGVDVEKMVTEEYEGKIEIPAILVKNPRKNQFLNQSIITTDFDEFLAAKPDVVLEVAGHQTIQKYAIEILSSGIDLLVTSVGAFTDDKLYDGCIATARKNGTKLILPSAGIGSLDTLSAAAVGGLTFHCFHQRPNSTELLVRSLTFGTGPNQSLNSMAAHSSCRSAAGCTGVNQARAAYLCRAAVGA